MDTIRVSPRQGDRPHLMVASGHTFQRRHFTAELTPASWAGAGSEGTALCGAAVVDQELVDDHHDTVEIPRQAISQLPLCKRCERLIPETPRG